MSKTNIVERQGRVLIMFAGKKTVVAKPPVPLQQVVVPAKPVDKAPTQPAAGAVVSRQASRLRRSGFSSQSQGSAETGFVAPRSPSGQAGPAAKNAVSFQSDAEMEMDRLSRLLGWRPDGEPPPPNAGFDAFLSWCGAEDVSETHPARTIAVRLWRGEFRIWPDDVSGCRPTFGLA